MLLGAIQDCTPCANIEFTNGISEIRLSSLCKMHIQNMLFKINPCQLLPDIHLLTSVKKVLNLLLVSTCITEMNHTEFQDGSDSVSNSSDSNVEP